MEGGTVKRKLPEECSSTDESKKLKHDQKSKVVNNGKKQVNKNGQNNSKQWDFAHKRKVAVLLGYCGAKYHGMQKNPDVDTIERRLLEALTQIKAVPDDKVKMFLDLNENQISFQRAARTDKGVSAARQVVSLKLVAEPSFVEDINKHLPDDIRVFGIERTTRPFDAKASCSGRSYEYLLPTFALAPSKEEFDPSYRISEKQLQNVSNFYKRFEGTHNFHNFTSGKSFDEKSSKRYITLFKPGKPFEKDGHEFLAIEVEGQSFMIHQIRKMVGLGMALLRGYCDESFFDQSFQSTKLDIPKAPGLGLLLNNVYFKQYNKKFGNDGFHNPLTFDYAQVNTETFKKSHIYETIIKEEIENKSMISWLKTLNLHTYKEAGTSLAEQQLADEKSE